MKTLLYSYIGFADEKNYSVQEYFKFIQQSLKGKPTSPSRRYTKARIALLKRLYEEGELRCAICGAPVLHARLVQTSQDTQTMALFGEVRDGEIYTYFNIDHIVPVAITQDLGPANLQLTCLCCNSAKDTDYTAADVDQVLANLKVQEKLYKTLREQKEPRDKQGLKSLIVNNLK